VGNLWPWHLNISPFHSQTIARTPAPQGTCTAGEGLDAETFRGFQLAGELFLLTSFFIEPNVHNWADNLRIAAPNRLKRAGLGKLAGALAINARGHLPPVCPFFASKHRCVVNQKLRENFEVENIWLPKRRKVRL
jgi:hypothetical protein